MSLSFSVRQKQTMKNVAVFLALILLCGCRWTPGNSKTRALANDLIAGFAIYRTEFGSIPDLSQNSVFEAMYHGNPKRLPILAPTDDEAKERAFLDAWNRAFHFHELSGRVIVMSSGKDGVFGSTDDIIVSEK